MRHIVCFHLLNDYSGSPMVLRMALRGLLRKGYHVDLTTTKGGVLDELGTANNLRRHTYSYQFSSNGMVTMLRYLWAQAYTFVVAFRWWKEKDIVFYINTLLPAGPAIAGRMMGKKVVYHYHENADAKGAFYKVLAWIMQKIAHRIVCVSDYQASMLQCQEKITVIPNALPEEFAEKMTPDGEAAFERKNILMLSSLKTYKGTDEFIRLAQQMPEYQFTLVVNDEEKAIRQYIEERRLEISGNLRLYPRQKDVTEFYRTASIVMNLTNKELAVETFGLTALEAMTAGLPVIGPTVGGIAGIIEDGVNGYKIDCQETERIKAAIRNMLKDRGLYLELAHGAIETSKRYSEPRMVEAIEKALDFSQ